MQQPDLIDLPAEVTGNRRGALRAGSGSLRTPAPGGGPDLTVLLRRLAICGLDAYAPPLLAELRDP